LWRLPKSFWTTFEMILRIDAPVCITPPGQNATVVRRL
jgi:hypothetical protein